MKCAVIPSEARNLHSFASDRNYRSFASLRMTAAFIPVDGPRAHVHSERHFMVSGCPPVDRPECLVRISLPTPSPYHPSSLSLGRGKRGRGVGVRGVLIVRGVEKRHERRLAPHVILRVCDFF